MLVFSDGDDAASWLDRRDVLRAAQRSDVVIHAVTRKRGFRYPRGGDARTRATERRLFAAEPQLFGHLYLSQLVEETGGSLFIADSSELQEAFTRVVNEVRSRYVLTYSPNDVAATGWHAIEVTLNGRQGDVQARR